MTTLGIESNVRRISLIPFLLLLAFPALPLLGQQAAPPPICVVFTVNDLSAGSDTKDYEQTITQAVSAAFRAGDFQVLPDSAGRDAASARSIDPGRPISGADAVDVGRGLGAALAVTGVYSVQNDEVYYSIQCWDVATSKLAAGIQATTPFNLAFFSGLNLALTTDLIPRLHPEAPREAGVVFTSSDEGMEVTLSGDQDIGRITNGRVTLPKDSAAPGTKAVLRKTRPGYHASEQTVTLTTAKEIPLKPLAPEHHFALELNSTLGQLLGLGAAVRSYRNPDWFFIDFGGYLWLQPAANFAPRVLLHSDFFAGAGSYLFLPPDAPVRFGLSTGAGFIMSFPSQAGLPTYVDVYLDVVNWWLEAGFPGTTFFIRQEFKYAVGIGSNLLGQGWMVSQFPPTTVGVLFRW
jgi:hypothetical protein